jgi:hypothetical protein
VAAGLRKQPILLFGFGALLAFLLLGGYYGAPLLAWWPVPLAIFVVTMAAYLLHDLPASRRSRPTSSQASVKIRGKVLDLDDSANVEGVNRSSLKVRGRGQVTMRGSGNVRPSQGSSGDTAEGELAGGTRHVALPAQRDSTQRDSTTSDHPRTGLAAILQAARANRPARFDVVGDSGCGKTMLLDEVADHLKESGYLVLFVTAQAPAYGSSGDEHGRLLADQTACWSLINALAEDVRKAHTPSPDGSTTPLLGAAAGRHLEERLLASRDPVLPTTPIGVTSTIDIRGEEVRLTDSGSVVVHVDQSGTEQLRTKLHAMRGQLVTVLGGVARRRRLAVIIDDLQSILATAAGDWLLSVLDGLPGTLIVHARRPEPELRRIPGVHTIRLKPMDGSETTGYVRRQLMQAGWDTPAADACADIIFTATGGHQIGVATCCQILIDSRTPSDATPAMIRERIVHDDQHWGDAGAFAAIRAFVDAEAAKKAGRPVRLFDLLVVLRRCTPELLTAVLARQGVDADTAAEIYDWLAECAFTSWFDDDLDKGWRLHDYLRENIEQQLQRSRPAEYPRLHQIVERYYRERLNFEQELDTASPVTSGPRYENPDWQRDSREWLHHASHLGRDAFTGTKRALIRLYLEAFWWWDCELPSGYCDQLIAAYRALPAGLDLGWIGWLADFQAGYVAGQQFQVVGRDAERWAQAAEALSGLSADLGLRRGRVPADFDLRRIYVIVCVLGGDVAWYGSDGGEAARETAAAWYQAAATACTDPAEHWFATWALWYESRLWAEADPDRAHALLDGMEERIDEDEDNELRALVAETYATIAWQRGDQALALDIHTRAVLHSYVYNVRQEIAAQHPNHYSQLRYLGALRAAEQRFAEAPGDIARAAQARARQFFALYWQHANEEPASPMGFPAPPRTEDLGSSRTLFAQRATWTLYTMTRQLEEPLETPLPR